jgi:hypothetical protein
MSRLKMGDFRAEKSSLIGQTKIFLKKVCKKFANEKNSRTFALRNG